MAEVTVFVDDAVLGTLPAVCAKDGIPTGDRLKIRDEMGDRAGLGVAWLLLLAGPLGWLGLLIISTSRSGRGETLTVEVPMSEPAYQRLRAARRMRRYACIVGVAGGAVAVAMLLQSASAGAAGPWQALALIGAVAVLGAIVALYATDGRIRRALVGIDLDASRRWVTLSGVHPAFVAACRAQQQERQRA